MTDFALCHAGTWRQGQFPQVTSVTYVVSYDGTHHAYTIKMRDIDDFFEWVVQNWEIDSDPRGEGEGDLEYLDRIGCNVREFDIGTLA